MFYQRALAQELPLHNLEFSREVSIDVYYKGTRLGKKRVDFVIDEVMVEIKARYAIEPVHFVQAMSYLKASGFKVGLLLNFGAAKLGIRRLVN